MNFFFKSFEPSDMERLEGVIVTGEELVRIQKALFSDLTRKGLATEEAHSLLSVMEEILKTLREQKKFLKRHFSKVDGEGPAPVLSRPPARQGKGKEHRGREQPGDEDKRRMGQTPVEPASDR